MRHIYSSLTFAIIGGVMAMPAHATLIGLNSISPGGSVSPGNATNTTGSVAASIGCPASFLGTTITPGISPVTIEANSKVVGDTCNQTVAFSQGGLLRGTVTLREIVAQEQSGTLDFYLQATYNPNLNGGAFGIARVFADPFKVDPSDLVGSYVGAKLLTPAPSGGPSQVVDAASSGAGGGFGGNCTIPANDCITFDFNTLRVTTQVLVISTNDMAFTAITRQDAGVNMGDGTNSYGLDTFLGFAPIASQVPEPVSIVLTGTMLALSAVFIRRRRSSAKNDLSVS
jgi:hypothetical protein